MTAVAKKIPALRFPEFEGEWIRERLGKVFEIFNGYAFSSSDACEEGVKWVKIADVGINQMRYDNLSYLPGEFIKKHKKFLLKKGDYVIALTRPILSGNLKIAQIDDNFDNSLLNQRVGKILSSNDLGFVYNLLQRRALIVQIENNIAGTDPPNLSTSAIDTIKAFIPPLSEQQKIATFLSTIDTRIQQLSRKKALLEQYKKGVMQQVFSQEIRFKDEEGKEFPEWEEKRLSAALSVSSKRNNNLRYGKEDVLSVSGEHGIVNQIAFMGRSYAGESVANYHVVENGDIVYTKSPLKANPYGIIKVNKGAAGIVSTLYAVYQVKENFSGLYLEYYFQLDDNTNSYLRPLVRKGAKNDMKINNSHVLTGKITVPTLFEQQKIVAFLTAIDGQIDLVSQQLERMQAFKKGLLQQLFV